MRKRVLVLDNHQVVADGLIGYLSTLPEVETIQHVTCCENFIEHLNNEMYDIAFMEVDIALNGVNYIHKALAVSAITKLIGFTYNDSLLLLETAIESGIHGYLLKKAGYKEIGNAIDTIINGEQFFSPDLILKLNRRIQLQKQAQNALSRLTVREKEVLKLICSGDARLEIAKKLNISEKTVDKHRSNLLVKTKSKNSVALVKFAFENNMLN